MSIRVLLLQADGFLRSALKALLERHGQFSVVGVTASESEALEICKTEAPEIALIDFSIPQLNGVTAIIGIRREHPQIKVVALSDNDREDAIIGAFRSGARAFVLKNSSDSRLIEILDVVSKGGSYLTVDMYQQLLHRWQSRKADSGDPTSKLGRLSPRERETLRLVTTGQCTKDVAVTLGLSFETARSYRKTMMKKLGVNNLATLTAFAIANGVVNPEKPCQDQMAPEVQQPA